MEKKMKHVKGILLLALAACGALLLASCSSSGGGTCSISGIVKDQAGNNLSSVTITYADGLSSKAYKTVTTATDGSFEIFNLSAGSHVLTYSLTGYATYKQAVSISVPYIEQTTAMGNGSATMYAKTATVSGTARIQKASGYVTQAVPVILYYNDANIADAWMTTTTAADGTFSFTSVPKAAIYIVAGPVAVDALSYTATSSSISLQVMDSYKLELALGPSATNLILASNALNGARLSPDSNITVTFAKAIDGAKPIVVSNLGTSSYTTSLDTAKTTLTIDPSENLAAGTTINGNTLSLSISGYTTDGIYFSSNLSVTVVSGMVLLSSSINTLTSANSVETYATSVIPTYTFNSDISGYDIAGTYLYNNYNAVNVEATISTSGKVLTITPTSTLIPGIQYTAYYKVFTALDSGNNYNSGSYSFYTAPSVMTPGQVTGFATSTTTVGGTTNSFSFMWDRVSNAYQYIVYAYVSGKTNAVSTGTISDPTNYAAVSVPASLYNGLSYPLNGQSVTFFAVAVSRYLVNGSYQYQEGTPSSGITFSDTASPIGTLNAMPTVAGLTLDNTAGTSTLLLQSGNMSNVDAKTSSAEPLSRYNTAVTFTSVGSTSAGIAVGLYWTSVSQFGFYWSVPAGKALTAGDKLRVTFTDISNNVGKDGTGAGANSYVETTF